MFEVFLIGLAIGGSYSFFVRRKIKKLEKNVNTIMAVVVDGDFKALATAKTKLLPAAVPEVKSTLNRKGEIRGLHSIVASTSMFQRLAVLQGSALWATLSHEEAAPILAEVYFSDRAAAAALLKGQ